MGCIGGVWEMYGGRRERGRGMEVNNLYTMAAFSLG